MTSIVYPPGPKSFIFGVDLHVASQRDPLGFMEWAVREHGDVVHFKIGRRHVYLLRHPDHIKDVFTTHYANFLKGRGIVRQGRIFGEGLLTSEGDFHRLQRQLIQPGFRPQRIAGYGAKMAEVAADASEHWVPGKSLPVLQEMREITLSIAHQTLFGATSGLEDQQVIEAFRELLPRLGFLRPAVIRFFGRLAFVHQRRLRKAGFIIQSTASRMIAERKCDTESGSDVLALLLSRTDVEDKRLNDDDQLRDELMTLLVASFDNLATALTWTWYLLAKHPAVQEQLHRELDQVLGGRLPTSDDLPLLGYTRKVLEEAMRLYPPVPRLVRTAVREYQVGGYTVPAGALVIISQYLAHRDSRYYPEPDRFDPERWTPEAKRARHPYSYFPFGGGPRRCIAESFAYMEGVLVLATLASRWTLNLTSLAPIKSRVTHFLHPRGDLPMIAQRRSIPRDR